MTTVRQKVLAYFMKTRAASAREVARALKLSAATVRHHLRVLAADGRLEIVPSGEQEGRGRPEKIYAVPQWALGDNLAVLSDILLTEAGSSVRRETFAQRLAGDARFAGQPLARQLNLTVEKLNQMNYHARWEAGSEGPRIIFNHCPYAAIVDKHPELCDMDVNLLSHLMGRFIVRQARPETQRKGTCPFFFSIG